MAGTVIAYKGVGAIEGATKILVPLLLLIGVVVVVVGFTSIPPEAIWDYRPDNPSSDHITSYIISIEANFAFVITLVGGMAEVPRLVKNERAGFWAGVIAGDFRLIFCGNRGGNGDCYEIYLWGND